MDMVGNIWNVITTYYISSPIWLMLTVLAIIYIIYTSKRTTRRRIIMCSLFAILIILNEGSYRVLTRIFDAASYYRFLWVMPYIMIVAVALLRCLQRLWNKKEKVVAILLVVSLVGTLYMSQGDYFRRMKDNMPQNKYLVANDMLQLRDVLQSEKDQGKTSAEPVLACPQMVMLQYQTIDARCQVLTDRNLYLTVRGYGEDLTQKDQRTQDAYLLSTICEDGETPDVQTVREIMERQGVNYLIVNSNAELSDYMENLGCVWAGQTDTYTVYRYDGKLSCERTTDATQVAAIKEHYSIHEDEIELDLGLEQQYKLLTVNDMHIITMDSSVKEAYQSTVNQRQNELFLNDTAIHSQNTWDGISAILDSYQAEGIVFIGDMIDYNCESNLQILQSGLNKVQTPYIYLRADHDLGVWYTDGERTDDKAREASSEVAPWQDMFIQDYGEFYLLGWNNATSQLSAQGLARAEEVFTQAKKEQKPIILTTHVPLNSTIDNGLKKASEEFDPQGRAKLWGEGCLYEPDATTGRFLDMILAEDSPVKAVLAGHLHFKYTTQLNANITEYVLDKGFSGDIGVIQVK